jgi:predicted Rossmann fold nucleotide-binding protein DprA/Smf involved in DNA uptake
VSGYEASSVEQIILTSGLTAGQVCSMLLLLEVEGYVGKTDTGDYIRLL